MILEDPLVVGFRQFIVGSSAIGVIEANLPVMGLSHTQNLWSHLYWGALKGPFQEFIAALISENLQ